MKRTVKIILTILSWAPLVWTILILIASHIYHNSTGSFSFDSSINLLKEYFRWALFFYVFCGGFFIWLALSIFLTWRIIITKKQCITNISLVTIGIVLAYLAFKYDAFGVIDYYFD